MAFIQWSKTFLNQANRTYEPLVNAAVSVYLSGTETPARLFLEDTTEPIESVPQGYTDENGYLRFYVDSDDYQANATFDVEVTPDSAFNTGAVTYYDRGIMPLQSAGRIEGGGILVDPVNGDITISTGGTVAISGGAINLTSGTSTWSGGTIAINGTAITISATGALNISAGTHTWSGGTFTWSGGTIGVTGTAITISASGALNISAGTHTWSGGTFNLSGGTFNLTAAAVNISSTAKLTVTAASGIDIDTGGSLVVTGGSISVTSGSISISSTGSFSMSAGTFEITGGTISISASSGLTIASGSKITINSTDGIYFSTSTQIYSSGGTNYWIPQTDNSGSLELGSSSYRFQTISLETSTTVGMYTDTYSIYVNETTHVKCVGNFTPSSSAAGWDNGTSAAYWDDGYFDTLYQHTGSVDDQHATSFDHLDDLEIINQYGGEKSPQLFEVLPVECTNIKDLAKEEDITVEEVYSRPDLRGRIFYNPMLTALFSLGGIKQLYNRVIELEKRLS